MSANVQPLEPANVDTHSKPYPGARITVAALVTLLVLPVAVALTPAPAAASTTPDRIDLTGHGWGHGRGMGQYGSLGYAIDHGWAWTEILDHYYGSTVRSTISNRDIKVRLMAGDGRPTIASASGGNVTARANGVALRTAGEITVTRTGTNTFTVATTSSCGASVVSSQSVSASQIDITSSTGRTTVDCGRTYAGTISTVSTSFGTRRVNTLPIETYIRGVVPSEMPASWGNLGEGSGMHALRVQSVAARSYAAAEDRYEYAHTCDTISCQVYTGLATHALTDQAIADTAGVVMQHVAKSGIARTEFSSSTGGHTIGGEFPAVPDDGDTVSYNPNHTWTTSISATSIESRYGAGRTLADVDVTEVMGVGPDGGHATEVTITFTDGWSTTVTANEFRRAFGLKSNWFRVEGDPPPPGATAVSDDTSTGSGTHSGTTEPQDTPTFPDVSGVHAEAIGQIAALGITTGYEDGTFRPDLPVTRAQMASFLARAFPEEIVAATDPAPFDDVTGTHAEAIAAIAEAGITGGCDFRLYCPEDSVTRGQMATFLVRVLPHVAIEGDDCGFSDTLGTTHAHNICHAAADGIATGFGDGTFGPDLPVTRAQMASFLVRALAVAG